MCSSNHVGIASYASMAASSNCGALVCSSAKRSIIAAGEPIRDILANDGLAFSIRDKHLAYFGERYHWVTTQTLFMHARTCNRLTSHPLWRWPQDWICCWPLRAVRVIAKPVARPAATHNTMPAARQHGRFQRRLRC